MNESSVETKLQYILYSIYRERKTGVLLLRREKEEFKILFEGGNIVNLLSNYIPQLSLGEYLVSNKNINVKDRDLALQESRETGQQMGLILVRSGKISPYILFESIRIISLKKIDYLMSSWSSDLYIHFVNLSKIGENYNILNLNTEKIIFESFKKIHSTDKLKEIFKKVLYATVALNKNAPYKTENLNLQPFEIRILSSLHSPQTLRQVISASELNLKDFIQSLYAFLALDILEFKEEGEISEIDFFKIDSLSIIKEIEKSELSLEEEKELQKFVLEPTLITETKKDEGEFFKEDFSSLIRGIKELLERDTTFKGWEKETMNYEKLQNLNKVINYIKLPDEHELVREIKNKAYLGDAPPPFCKEESKEG